MSDTEAVVSDETAITTEGTSNRRGRPRPESTIERDQFVLTHVPAGEDGRTRAEIVAAIPDDQKLSPSVVYLSLFRLRNNGVVECARVDGQHRWRLVQSTSVEADV